MKVTLAPIVRSALSEATAASRSAAPAFATLASISTAVLPSGQDAPDVIARATWRIRARQPASGAGAPGLPDVLPSGAGSAEPAGNTCSLAVAGISVPGSGAAATAGAASALLGYMAPPSALGLVWQPETFGV